MDILIPILKLCAGIGLFLFGMYFLEESLKKLSGRNFKLFLKRTTKNKVGAVAGGAIVAAILQSSSMVSLMVLAFVGAGVFTMRNALAVILGANLGTTIDSWLVATLGFKSNIEIIAYPVIFIGGVLLILFSKRILIKYLSYFLLGFGLLFIGLAFMKTAMEVQVKAFDFKQYANMPSFAFLVIGFLITLLVQSSSVTMALTLTALHVGAVNLHVAAAIVLGSETGTTIKIVLSGIGGTASKKQVVLGNLLFNIILTFFAFLFLKQLLQLILTVFKINDPLISLVTFSTLVNLLSILIFLPFLDNFSRFLEKFFTQTDVSASAFINSANVEEPQTAFELFKMETEYFIYNCFLFNMEQLEIDTLWFHDYPNFKSINDRKKIALKTSNEKYDFLKLLQGELQIFYLLMREKLTSTQFVVLNQLNSSIRNAMYSTKSMNDIQENILNLKRSSKNIKFDLLNDRKKQTEDIYQKLNFAIKRIDGKQEEELILISDEVDANYNKTLIKFYNDAKTEPIDSADMTVAINFNRELHTSNKMMIMAVKDFIANEKQDRD